MSVSQSLNLISSLKDLDTTNPLPMLRGWSFRCLPVVMKMLSNYLIKLRLEILRGDLSFILKRVGSIPVDIRTRQTKDEILLLTEEWGLKNWLYTLVPSSIQIYIIYHYPGIQWERVQANTKWSELSEDIWCFWRYQGVKSQAAVRRTTGQVW